MKLPAVAIAAALAGGILLGGLHLLQWLERPSLLVTLVAATFVLLILGFVLTWRGAIWSASGVSLAGWLALGILVALIAGRPLPSEHVLSRFAANQIPQHTPLRWHGVLRDEPARLPWGYGMDISLTGVETADGYVPTAGGMRLGFAPRDGDTALPELHAGDEIAALPKRVFRSLAQHGSKNSTMAELLNAVAPQISIISAGEVNPYGHPSPELLQRLEESGTRIYRTDQDGAVRVLTDGESLEVSYFNDCANRTAVSAKTQPPNDQQTSQQ
jgi:hypothetical protein